MRCGAVRYKKKPTLIYLLSVFFFNFGWSKLGEDDYENTNTRRKHVPLVGCGGPHALGRLYCTGAFGIYSRKRVRPFGG